MGLGEKKKEKSDSSSSSESDDVEKESEEMKKKRNIPNDLCVVNQELVYGEQLQDDIINTFCDKLQAVCPKKLDGLMAIQFITCEPENVKKHISGKNETIQILYDKSRSHYVLTYFNPEIKKVIIYDSLQTWNGEIPTLPGELCDYIRNLYAHLFQPPNIGILFEKNYERQSDDFSCGYRSIGAVVDIARGENPVGKVYSRTAILTFIQQILKDPKPTWEKFKMARLHRGERSVPSNSRVEMFLKTHSSAEVSTSNSSIESRSSTQSQVSSVLSDINNNDSSRNTGGRESDVGEESEIRSEPIRELKKVEVDSPKQSYSPISPKSATHTAVSYHEPKMCDPVKYTPAGIFSSRELFGYSTLKRVFMFSSFLSTDNPDPSKE